MIYNNPIISKKADFFRFYMYTSLFDLENNNTTLMINRLMFKLKNMFFNLFKIKKRRQKNSDVELKNRKIIKINLFEGGYD